MPITNVLATVTVTDWEAALPWYENFFGRPADLFPMDGLAEWQVTPQGGLQLGQEDERAGSASVTLVVDDIEGQVAELAGRDIAIGEIVQGGTGAAFAMVEDPEGNRIVVASVLSAG